MKYFLSVNRKGSINFEGSLRSLFSRPYGFFGFFRSFGVHSKWRGRSYFDLFYPFANVCAFSHSLLGCSALQNFLMG